MSAQQIYVGVDIGTTEVRTVVGTKIDDQETPSIIGSGVAPNRGMRRGVVVNIDEVAASIVRSVEQAERISGQRVQRATVGINGSHILSLSSRGVVAIGGAEHEIDVEDLARAEEAAMVVQLPANRDILQIFPRNYHLDGQENIKDPLGMSGIRLEIDALMVTGSVPSIKALDRACERADIHILNKIVCGLAASEAVLQPIQRESGAVVVDIGAATTNMAVFEEDDIQHVAVLPVGSVHITNDLAIGLRTDLAIADKVKLSHAKIEIGSYRKNRRTIRLEHNEQAYAFDSSEVEAIVTARLEELFEVVNKELKKISKDGRLPGGVVLTGGGALLPGIDELAKKCLGLPAHIGIPYNFAGVIDVVSSPRYATAVGLMMLGMRMQSSESGMLAKSHSIGGFFKRLIKNFIP